MKISDPSTKWSFECAIDPSGTPPAGGLQLKDMQHDGHNFAKDVRVIGLWIETQQITPPDKVTSTSNTFYILDASNFTVSQIAEHKPSPTINPTYSSAFDYLKQTDAALSFTEYFKPGGSYAGYGLSAKYEAPALLAGLGNCEYAGLTVEQIFLFAPYAKVPKHEPSGGLSAARFHPMMRFAFTKNASFDNKKPYTKVNSIRFDYRLQLYLDRYDVVASNSPATQLGNQAGLFADSDTFIGTAAGSILPTIGSSIWNLSPTSGVASGSFDSVEKPLILEVATAGLVKGLPVFQTPNPRGGTDKWRCWDNIHWWGARGAGNPVISAPGAFHCAHLHWRWGAAAVPVTFDNKFNSLVWPKDVVINSPAAGMWGPLVDPAIWIQSIRVAVVKNDPSLDPSKGVAASALSKNDWKSLFKPGLRAAPTDIEGKGSGADIVLYYSTEVHHDVAIDVSPPAFLFSKPTTFTNAAGGTVFLHGLFFAHDAEIKGLMVGTTKPIYWNRDEYAIRATPDWTRLAL